VERRVENKIIRLPLDLTSISSSGKIEAEITVNKWNSPEGSVKYISKCNLNILPYKPMKLKPTD